jgi:hypothetical protein
MSDSIFKRKPSELVRVERGLKALENEVYQEATEILYAGIKHAFDWDYESKEMPAEWLEELDNCESDDERMKKTAELGRRKRIAQAAMMSSKEAPIAFKLAQGVFVGMQKARAMEGNGNRSLNVTVVSITEPMPVFEEKEIAHE